MSEIIKKIRLCALCFLMAYNMPCYVMAQTAGKLQRTGDTYFAAGDYYSAIKIYSAVLYDSPLVNKAAGLVYPFRPSNHAVKKLKPAQKAYLQYQLAESYRLCYHYKEALPQYEQYLSSQDTKFPLARLWYGLCELANDQPEKAVTALNAFLQKYKTVDSFTQKAKQGIVNSNFTIRQRSIKPIASVTKFNPILSIDGSNFAFEKLSDTDYLFTTSRHELDKKNEKIYPVRLYKGDLQKGSIKTMDDFPGTDMNMATSSLSADGLTLYFTGWKEDGSAKKTYYHIFYTTRASVQAQWSKPVALSAPVNTEGFHSKQPFITRDGKYLIFASDRPGGSGKFDLWIAEMNEGKPVGNAMNAGTNVNSEGEEAAPFYDARTETLYFSSNGREGMGGMDLFKISKGSLFTEWAGTPVNLGAPFNSVKDDIYYSTDQHSDMAYLSSDRASTCCMEIFKVVMLPKHDTVFLNAPVKEPARIIDTVYITKNENRRLLDSVKEVTVDRMYVNYRFASVKIRKEDYQQLNRIVDLLKKDAKLNILVASFTDCIGSESANTIISRKRSESVKSYLAAHGIDPSRINIDFFGKKHFVLACKEDTSYHTEKQMANRRSDLIVTSEKNPKWQPSGKELDLEKGSTIYPKIPLHTVSVEGDKKQNSAGKEKLIADVDPTLAKTAETKNVTDRIVNNKENGKQEGRSKYLALKSDEGSKRKSVKESVSEAKNKPTVLKNEQTQVAENKIKGIPEPYLNKPTLHSADSSLKAMKISELLDPTPRLKGPTIIDQMTSRTPKKSFEVFSVSDSVKVELYDNGVFDYDTVSVIYNKNLVVYKEMLRTNKPITFYVKLNPEPKRNEMIFFAENLGLTPPNSALMIITDGEKKRTEINVSSDLDHNSVIYFIKVNKKKQ